MYNNGYEFWKDLKLQFGDEAFRVANDYLDMQIFRVKTDAEEMQFCRELYAAINSEN